MPLNKLEATQEVVTSKTASGMNLMVTMELRPNNEGKINASLDNGSTTVLIDIQRRTVEVQSNTDGIQITRTYNVGHPVSEMSGNITKVKIPNLAVVDGGKTSYRVNFSLDSFKFPFPDNHSHVTVRNTNGVESVNLF